MIIDPLIFLLVSLGTLLIGGLSVVAARGIWQRLLLAGMYSGLWLYSGVGAAYTDVPEYYLLYYFGFLVVFAFAFWIFGIAFVHLSIRSGQGLTRVLQNVNWHPIWPFIIWIYLLLYLMPLVYPDFRLPLLLAPMQPDLKKVWAAKWAIQEIDVLLKLLDYAKVLLTPLFYIALFRYRQHIVRVVLVFLALYYLQYIANGYIGRSVIVMGLATIWIALWVDRPNHRRALMAIMVALIPIVFVFAYYYSVIRIGGSLEGVTSLDAIVRTLEVETSFPSKVGIPIIESGERGDIAEYIRWILTLPIPKLLTGTIEGARINYEISEIVLGIAPGEKGWYVVLPGLVAESVYIYGQYFFWLHAVFIAFLAALVIRLMVRTPQLLFLLAYVVVIFAYTLNRGGISSLLIIIVNDFMLFYFIAFACIFGLLGRRKLAKTPARNESKVGDDGGAVQ
jgi:hypothetical protein